MNSQAPLLFRPDVEGARMMAFAFIGLMRIMASPEKTVVARPAPCVYRKLDSAIVVMKAAEDGHRHNVAHVLDGAMDRSVLVERPMSPQTVIVGGILR